MNALKVMTLILVTSGMMAHAANSSNETFRQKHPRRAEVNRRIRNQDRRINQGVKNGTLTPQQAQQLRGEEAGVKAQERAEVKANGGYLTKGEQKQMNQELNQDSKQIYADKHGGAAPPAAGSAPVAPTTPPSNN